MKYKKNNGSSKKYIIGTCQFCHKPTYRNKPTKSRYVKYHEECYLKAKINLSSIYGRMNDNE